MALKRAAFNTTPRLSTLPPRFRRRSIMVEQDWSRWRGFDPKWMRPMAFSTTLAFMMPATCHPSRHPSPRELAVPMILVLVNKLLLRMFLTGHSTAPPARLVSMASFSVAILPRLMMAKVAQVALRHCRGMHRQKRLPLTSWQHLEGPSMSREKYWISTAPSNGS